MQTHELGDIGFGYRPRAAYASDPLKSRGRFADEPESPTRTAFQRDRDRIIHSTAFRRLKHKTQVFVAHEGDHYRTRLTHSIEVAQIARALARALRVDEDLAEAVALVHDFGHTPFGHTGEEALDAKMAAWGGFDHNAQSLRVVTRLERRYAEFDGLNLTWETLEGLVKHNGPLTDADGRPLGLSVPQSVLDFSTAVTTSNWDDSRASRRNAPRLPTTSPTTPTTSTTACGPGCSPWRCWPRRRLVGPILGAVRQRYPGLDAVRTGHELMRRQITAMVEDVIATSAAAISAAARRRRWRRCTTPGDSSCCSRSRWRQPSRRSRASSTRTSTGTPTSCAFAPRPTASCATFSMPISPTRSVMPEGWREVLVEAEDRIKARHVADFLAGMTDTYALKEHRRLFDRTPDLG